MMSSLSAFLFWFLRAWPVLALVPIALIHAYAYQLFPTETIMVNKLTGIILQVVGGLIVLYSVNANLGLFREQHLGSIIIGWLKSVPFLQKRTATVYGDSSCQFSISGSAHGTVRRAPETVEEKIAELDRQLEELRQHVNEDVQSVNLRIAQVHTDLSMAVDINAATLNQLSSRLEFVTVGGFKQQAFGVLLAIYGAFASVFS